MKKVKYILLTSFLSLCMVIGFSQGVTTDTTSLSSPSINNSGTVTNDPYDKQESNDEIIGSDVTENRANDLETGTEPDNTPTDLNNSGTATNPQPPGTTTNPGTVTPATGAPAPGTSGNDTRTTTDFGSTQREETGTTGTTGVGTQGTGTLGTPTR